MGIILIWQFIVLVFFFNFRWLYITQKLERGFIRIVTELLIRALWDFAVTKCNRAEIALSLLRENRNGFDIVISDVHMPDMDGFILLERIGLEMDLPVISKYLLILIQTTFNHQNNSNNIVMIKFM